MDHEAQPMDEVEVERQRRRAVRTAFTIMRRTWTGAMLPYINHLEKSGDSEQYRQAQTLRLRFGRAIEILDDLANGREPRWPEDDLGGLYDDAGRRVD